MPPADVAGARGERRRRGVRAGQPDPGLRARDPQSAGRSRACRLTPACRVPACRCPPTSTACAAATARRWPGRSRWSRASGPEDAGPAADLLDAILPHTGQARRVAITGVPGAGKSTLIDALGLHLVREHGQRVAVLSIDPSSPVSGGSLLGDKTRMARLAVEERAFVRPSPARGHLGGVAPRTREAIQLCEAAGFDTVFVETVGVGQSENRRPRDDRLLRAAAARRRRRRAAGAEARHHRDGRHAGHHQGRRRQSRAGGPRPRHLRRGDASLAADPGRWTPPVLGDIRARRARGSPSCGRRSSLTRRRPRPAAVASPAAAIRRSAGCASWSRSASDGRSPAIPRSPPRLGRLRNACTANSKYRRSPPRIELLNVFFAGADFWHGSCPRKESNFPSKN